jgi:hypothetical protein
MARGQNDHGTRWPGDEMTGYEMTRGRNDRDEIPLPIFFKHCWWLCLGSYIHPISADFVATDLQLKHSSRLPCQSVQKIKLLSLLPPTTSVISPLIRGHKLLKLRRVATNGVGLPDGHDCVRLHDGDHLPGSLHRHLPTCYARLLREVGGHNLMGAHSRNRPILICIQRLEVSEKAWNKSLHVSDVARVKSCMSTCRMSSE